MSTLYFKASLDNTSQPVGQSLVFSPLRQLALKDRRDLGMGPTFKLMVGEKMVGKEIPKRAAMAMSKFFNDALSKYPRSTTIMLGPHDVSEDCVLVIVDFITSNVKVNNPFNLRTKEHFGRELALYRHAGLFGMMHHAGSMRASLLEDLNHNIHIPSYNALNEISELPDTDIVYKMAVRRMEGLEHIGELTGDQEWLAWLNEHDHFAIDMDAWKAERKARDAEKREVQREINFERNFPALK
ncbi:uncharacterized protein N0V89_006812 [Didymosphaeria variabile]|uniref:Uncharacterized protein n=1 Tax=Didymosphaeria variabile TaxID=1932322 RepID=A0A9W8XI21_9PLEO|nr:uncharacterized protein N0V89_006812 [Didymosphaeria variabile]KAJ4351469.1 hypothetical protein N0V89_006812 [Didymosphaeria variabile]